MEARFLVVLVLVSAVHLSEGVTCTKNSPATVCSYRTTTTLRYGKSGDNCSMKSSAKSENKDSNARAVYTIGATPRCCWETTFGLECYNLNWDSKSQMPQQQRARHLSPPPSPRQQAPKDLTGAYTECSHQCFGFEQEFGVMAGAIVNNQWVPVLEKDVIFSKWSLLDTIDNSHPDKPCQASADVLSAATETRLQCAFDTKPNVEGGGNFYGNIEFKSKKLGTTEAYTDFATVFNERLKFYNDELEKDKKVVVMEGQVPNRVAKTTPFATAPKAAGHWVVVSTRKKMNPTVSQFTFGAQLSKLGASNGLFWTWANGMADYTNDAIPSVVLRNFIALAKNFYKTVYTKEWYTNDVLKDTQTGTYKNHMNPRYHFTLHELAACLNTKHNININTIDPAVITKDRDEQAFFTKIKNGEAIKQYDIEVATYNPATGIEGQCIVVFEKNGIDISAFDGMKPMLNAVGFSL